MSKTSSPWSRPILRLAVFGFIALFIAAPTPGNVGGCSSSAGSQRVMAGNTMLTPPQTEEFMYFDEGLCSSFCWRVRECGHICDVIAPNNCTAAGSPCTRDIDCCFGHCDATTHSCGTCDGNGAFEYAECVRGELNPGVVGTSGCPHACPNGRNFLQAYQWDVEACSDSILSLDCGTGIQHMFANAPNECVNVCRCDAPEVQCPNGPCADLQTDPNNCGTCGMRCVPGHICRAGTCR